jgi:hypothetical protein
MAPRQLSAEHKENMAAGRIEGRAVKLYLEALEQHRPRRGRKRTPESIRRRTVTIEHELATAGALQRLQLLQERRDLETELARADVAVDLTEVEAGFVKVAASYGARKGIAYATWRELGVPAEVLARAGVKRGS